MSAKKKKFRSPFGVSSKAAKFVGSARLASLAKSKNKSISTVVSPALSAGAGIVFGNLPPGSTGSLGAVSVIGCSVNPHKSLPFSPALVAGVVSPSLVMDSSLSGPIPPSASLEMGSQPIDGNSAPLPSESSRRRSKSRPSRSRAVKSQEDDTNIVALGQVTSQDVQCEAEVASLASHASSDNDKIVDSKVEPESDGSLVAGEGGDDGLVTSETVAAGTIPCATEESSKSSHGVTGDVTIEPSEATMVEPAVCNVAENQEEEGEVIERAENIELGQSISLGSVQAEETSGLAMLLVLACGAETFVPWTLLERAGVQRQTVLATLRIIYPYEEMWGVSLMSSWISGLFGVLG
ncbi:hypothetical protein YC2023_075965 [Brassica napus]